MTRTDAIVAFIATHGTNAPGHFITLADTAGNRARTGNATFDALYAHVDTDSDIDDIVDEMDEILGN